jgi:hypothetical protein
MHEILVLKGDSADNYLGAYVDGVLAWEDSCPDMTRMRPLFALFRKAEHSEHPVKVRVEDVPSEVVEAMGLMGTFPSDLRVYRHAVENFPAGMAGFFPFAPH